MGKKSYILFWVFVLLFVIIVGGYYFFVSSKPFQGTLETDSINWCESEELAQGIANTGIPAENIPLLVKGITASAKSAEQQAEKQGVQISQSEFCALNIVQTKISVQFGDEVAREAKRAAENAKINSPTSPNHALQPYAFSNPPSPSAADLEKYIGNDRAIIVLNYLNRELESQTQDTNLKAKDASAKSILFSAASGIRNCILEKTNRVLEPRSNQVLCQSNQENSQTILWGDIEKIDGSWGGCDFQVTRNAEGLVSDIKYCATLPSGIHAACTLKDCVYEN